MRTGLKCESPLEAYINERVHYLIAIHRSHVGYKMIVLLTSVIIEMDRVHCVPKCDDVVILRALVICVTRIPTSHKERMVNKFNEFSCIFSVIYKM